MLTRTGRIGLALALAAAIVTGSRAHQSLDALGATDPATALGAVLELALLGVSSWFLTAVALNAAPGALGRCGRALVPAAIRTTVFVGVVGAGFGGVAHAESTDWPVDGLQLPERALVEPSPARETAPETGPATEPTSPAPSTSPPGAEPEPPAAAAPAPPGRATSPAEDGRPAPRHRADRPTVPGSGSAAGPTAGGKSTGGAASHVVAPGDTLWALAATTLGPAASPQDVQRRVEAIHRANRDVIGADPDLIRPGQRIDLPTAEGARR